MAGMLSKLWDDVAGGSPPDKGMKQLRKQSSANSAYFTEVPSDAAGSKERRFSTGESGGEYQSPSHKIAIKKPQKIPMLDVDCPRGTPSDLGSTPPASPCMASPSTYSKENLDNIWHNVFHPGQKKALRKVGSDKFNNAETNSPNAYDWVMITALEG